LISIPSHQFYTTDWHLNEDGDLYDFDSDTRVLHLTKLELGNADDLPLLGFPFMSALSLSVDEDAGSFSVYRSANSETSKIVSYNSAGCAAASGTPTSGSVASSSSAASSVVSGPQKTTQPLGSSANTTSKTKLPFIIGGILGGLSALVIVVTISCMVVRKTSEKKQDTSSVLKRKSAMGTAKYEKAAHELSDDVRAAQELSDRDPAFGGESREIDGWARPHELPCWRKSVTVLRHELAG
jgi:hypothetical protein